MIINHISKLFLSAQRNNLNKKIPLFQKASLYSRISKLDENYNSLKMKYLFSSQPPKNNSSSPSSSSNDIEKSNLSDDNNQSRIRIQQDNEQFNSQNQKKFYDTTPDIKFTEENQDLLVNDYTNSPTHLKFQSSSQKDDDQSTSMALQGFYQNENGLSINQKSELQLKDNPLALKVLTEGKIDLRDERIIVNHLNTSDSALLSNIEGLHQISLGQVDVLPQNSILLEDIDVYNIPEDKDIVIDKNTKILLAIGKKVQKKKRRETTIIQQEEDQQEGELKDSKQNINSNNGNSRNQYELSINKKIFEELSIDEYKNKYLWNFEKDFVTFDIKMLMRSLIGTIPVLIIFFMFFDTFFELFKCKRDITLMEEQLINPFLNIRRSLQSDILLNDPKFDRKKLFPEEFEKLYNKRS